VCADAELWHRVLSAEAQGVSKHLYDEGFAEQKQEETKKRSVY
jgi:hypothetical protein